MNAYSPVYRELRGNDRTEITIEREYHPGPQKMVRLLTLRMRCPHGCERSVFRGFVFWQPSPEEYDAIINDMGLSLLSDFLAVTRREGCNCGAWMANVGGRLLSTP